MPVCLSTPLVLIAAILPQLVSSALLATLSSYQTLVSTNYVLNMTFTSVSVPASTIPTLTLSNRFAVDASTLQNCEFATTSASSYSTGTCSASTSPTAVTITFTDTYPSTLAAQTRLSLKVSIYLFTVYHKQSLGCNFLVHYIGSHVGCNYNGIVIHDCIILSIFPYFLFMDELFKC
jgi:hypothetical protein